MGDFKEISGAFRVYSKGEYERLREEILSHYDPAREMRVGNGLRCRVCHESLLFDDPAHNFAARCICRCTEEAQRRRAEAERRAVSACEPKLQPLSVLGRAYGAARFSSLDLKTSDDEYIRTAERCEAFCRKFEAVRRSGRGIWLWGGAGVGKTHMAACMLHELTDDKRSCLMTTAERINDAVLATYKSKAEESALEIKRLLSDELDVLFIDRPDSLFADRDSDKKLLRLAEIILERTDNALPTVILSRLSVADFAAKSTASADLMDRLAAKVIPLRLTGRNRFAQAPSVAAEF